MGTHRNEVKIESVDFSFLFSTFSRFQLICGQKKRRDLHQGAGATGAGAGGATKAMAAGEDFAILH